MVSVKQLPEAGRARRWATDHGWQRPVHHHSGDLPLQVLFDLSSDDFLCGVMLMDEPFREQEPLSACMLIAGMRLYAYTAASSEEKVSISARQWRDLY